MRLVGRRQIVRFLWLAYLLVPVDGWGFFPGRPLGLPQAVALAAVCWLWWVGRPFRLTPLVALALAAKVLLGATLVVPRGFEARYFANPDFSGTPEPSTEPAGRAFTRIDDRLAFGFAGAPDLPLHFFNEVARFNFYEATQPKRPALPFSVVWTGRLRVSQAGPQRVYVRAPGGSARVVIDDERRDVPARAAEWTADFSAGPGLHSIMVSLSVPQDGARQFEAGRIVDGRHEPFDARDVFRRRVSAVSLAVDRAVRWIAWAFDLLLAGWLAFAVASALRPLLSEWRSAHLPANAIALAWVVVIADALVFAWPAAGRMITLTGGDDWLQYEALSRDIGLHGVLMPAGSPLGHGRPFYHQPFYPYFLAACHWLLGEGLAGVYFVQRLLAGAAVIALWRTTAVLFGESIGFGGLVAAAAFAYVKLDPWSGVLLSEVLFVPLVCIWTFMLVSLACAPAPSRRQAFFAGIVGGMATLTRSPLLVGWVALAAVAAARRSVREIRPALVILTVTMIAVTSLATLRNWIAAHEFVPIASSGSVTLFAGNTPTVPVAPAPRNRQAFYDRLGLDTYSRLVLEYVRQAPAAFAAGLKRKALYTLGWFDRIFPGVPRSDFYIAMWVTALLGVLRLRATPTPSVWAALIPLIIAATHFAMVVLFWPQVYGDRLILPFYALIVPYIAIPLGAVAQLAVHRTTSNK